ncbi:GIY-YIG nuclease family protein [Maribacter thermophilus]|uniref:GIY-YIG nuclease family protein n=1 Tax=Maribacter thermophilus TaxID=1197874 RepID=UPI0012F858AD|nr:hypothetical protein [Maribacter thermophilus]
MSNFKNKQGIYLIKPLNIEVLKDICSVLDYRYSSNIAYIGKANLTKTSDLRKRARQEMGWSNFEGATFVRKIGLYLGFDVKDKKNKILREKTKEFICSNFSIECKVFETDNLQEIETDYIQKMKPCLNVRKVIKSV